WADGRLAGAARSENARHPDARARSECPVDRGLPGRTPQGGARLLPRPAQRQMSGFGGMISFEVKGGLEPARRVVERTRLFTLAESLGGVESLIELPAAMTHASIPAETRRAHGVADGLVRASVGIEDVADLISDLDRALAEA